MAILLGWRKLTELVQVPAVADGTPDDVVMVTSFFWLLVSFVCLGVIFHAIYVVCDEHLVPGTLICSLLIKGLTDYTRVHVFSDRSLDRPVRNT